MNIHLLAVGSKLPSWVDQGFEEYAKRLNKDVRLVLKEIPAEKRAKNASEEQMRNREGERLLAAVPKNALVVALEVNGRNWSTEQLAEQMEDWMQSGQDIVLMVGGPDGLSEACRQRADQQWSLSPLTLPHPLVRVVLAEQIYRAWSVIHNHPYHRGGNA